MTYHALKQRAAELWPDSRALQARWLMAVRRVRQTSRGWLLDQPIRKMQ